MSSVHNSVETVNAAATAIVTAESRVQPSAVQYQEFLSNSSNSGQKVASVTGVTPRFQFMRSWRRRIPKFLEDL